MGNSVFDAIAHVRASYTGNASQLIVLDKTADAISVNNRGASMLTFTIDGIIVTVGPGEVFDGAYAKFKEIDVQSTDAWAIVVYG